jgi:DNA-binding NtrC family response regulator
MVIDDDRDMCDNLWELFRSRRIRSCIVHAASEAESRLESGDFQVVLVDWKLADDDGLELVARIQARHPELPTVLITGHPGDLVAANPGLTDAVLFKPFDMPQLLETIQRLAAARE